MMKRILMAAVLCGSMVACNNAKEEKKQEVSAEAVEEKASENVFGAEFTANDSKPVSEVFTVLQDVDSSNTTLKGEVVEVCQKKGCWMTLKLEDDKTMRVTFKDYGFFVPKDISGKEVVINGLAKREVTDVETLKHFAEDAGKSAEEVAAITEPQTEVTFVADGVVVM